MTIMTLGKRFGDPNPALGFNHRRDGGQFHLLSEQKEAASGNARSIHKRTTLKPVGIGEMLRRNIARPTSELPDRRL